MHANSFSFLFKSKSLHAFIELRCTRSQSFVRVSENQQCYVAFQDTGSQPPGFAIKNARDAWLHSRKKHFFPTPPCSACTRPAKPRCRRFAVPAKFHLIRSPERSPFELNLPARSKRMWINAPLRCMAWFKGLN
jgi:hypothetical protein